MFKKLLLTALLLCTGSIHAAQPTILVLGNSLSAGFGIDARSGWVALLGERIKQEGYRYRLVNASISGDTTAGGLTRLPQALARHRPEIVIVELGGNDGLRGLPLGTMRRNLSRVVRLAHRRKAKVLLLGMRLPPNYGTAYTAEFHRIYTGIANGYPLTLVPFFLKGVAGKPELMQVDGIHPRVEAQPRLLANVWPYLQPLLEKP